MHNRLRRAVTPEVVRSSHAFRKYLAELDSLIKPGMTVLDVGAGRTWPLERKPDRLIGQDISADEMAYNPVLDERIVSDACRDLGVPDGSIDLISARAVVEHLPDNKAFLATCHRALKPGGRLISVFPNRYATFAMLNRSLPPFLARKVVHTLVPGSEGRLGFKAYYDRTNASAFRGLLRQVGFTVEQEYQSWFAPGYFAFFLPLYVMMMGTDYLRRATGLRDLAAFNLFIARK
jgi:SAM-dependent methyltransferase